MAKCPELLGKCRFAPCVETITIGPCKARKGPRQRAKAKASAKLPTQRDKAMLLDNFFAMVAESMESNNSTINNSNSNSHKGETMESKHNANAKAHNSKRNGRKANSKAHNSKQEAQPTLPDTLPERCNACIGKEGAKQDATTALIFAYHIRKALEAYNGQASICQVYNFLRGDSPLRLEQDGSPKQDGLPRWGGLGNSKLFRNYTEGTLLTYTHKPTSNGRIRSVAVAGPMLPEFPSSK